MSNFLDTFTEASDTLLTAHTPDTGTSWSEDWNNTLTPLHMNIVAAQDACQINGAENGVGAAVSSKPDPSLAEYDIEITINAVDPSTGTKPLWLLARWTDNNNYYALMIRPPAHASNLLELYKVVAGVATSLATIDNALVNNDVVKFQVRNAAKKAYINGVEKISTTDNALTASGKAGLGMGDSPNGVINANCNTEWRITTYALTEAVTARSFGAIIG